jgi:modification methylase
MASITYDCKQDRIWMDYLVPESQSHGGRYNIPLILALIHKYTKEGDTILDVMGGVGSILVATTLKRKVIMIELEDKFYDLALQNYAKIRRDYPLSADATIIHGDTRLVLPLPVQPTCIITSPPYGDAMKKADKAEMRMVEHFGSTTAQGYGESKDNIGNMPYAVQQWEMRDIYAKCYETLPIGGRMILITKDITRNGKRVEIARGTIAGCMAIGFSLEDNHKRLCQVTGMQNLHRKDPNYRPISIEDVLVFVK